MTFASPKSLVVCTFFVIGATARAASPDGVTFFEQKVRPLLVEHCYECHSPTAKKVKGGLLLDTKSGWEAGGDSGEPSVLPGKPEESLLIQAVRHDDPDTAMPPKKPKLPATAIADLVAWVRMGAPDPRTGGPTEVKRADKSWWSLQPLAKLDDSRTIDSFIEAKLAEQGLTMSAPADSRTLIRRVTYDLTGLPPTTGEVEAFAAETIRIPHSAFRNLVDRLLASPRYGERWGRHWMDVIRFGESNGFERNFNIDDVWPFRDYIIASLNADKPFNQFITEHLAADVTGRGDPQTELATAFLVCGPYDDVKNLDEKVVKEIRAVTLDDMVTATASAFLGLTVNCARCHHHKFDPIVTEDYYRIRAAFEGVTHGRRDMASASERAAYEAKKNPVETKLAEVRAERDALLKKVNDIAEAELKTRTFPKPKLTYEYNEDRFEPVKARYVKFLIKSHSMNIHTGVGARVDEFEVWSGDRNVALASNGGKAEGKHEREAAAADSEKSYGASLTIDGGLGTRWFAADPPVLTITLAQEQSIDRIVFSNAREGRVERDYAQGPLPVEYETQVSTDGQTWTTIATSDPREPWSRDHGILRMRRQMRQAEEPHLATLQTQVRETEAALKAIPPLPTVWAGLFAEPKEQTNVQIGGDPSRPGAQVLPASLAVLDKVTKPYALPANAPEADRRLALARWITSDDNPLTARVLANRVWHYHFGTGLVDTPGDFGFLGSRPTHPELLDYLATRLLAHGWRLKALHREILLSRAYQQASQGHSTTANFTKGQQLDRDARLLWRFPPRRLAAEEVRDTLLAVAGKLQFTPMGGPGFRLFTYVQDNVWTYFPIEAPGPETYRRAVYHQNIRAINVDVLGDFDYPDIAFSTPKRANTTTPMQAFTMLNHRFILDMAEALAARAKAAAASPEHAALADAAYRLALQRAPTAAERERATALIAKHGAPAFCRVLLNFNELLHLE